MKKKQVLYMMGNGSGLIKVGISNNPLRRKRQIELASGSSVSIIKCWQTLDATAFEVEQYLHRLFARKRKNGEWFENISVPDVEYAGYELKECYNDGRVVWRDNCELDPTTHTIQVIKQPDV